MRIPPTRKAYASPSRIFVATLCIMALPSQTNASRSSKVEDTVAKAPKHRTTERGTGWFALSKRVPVSDSSSNHHRREAHKPTCTWVKQTLGVMRINWVTWLRWLNAGLQKGRPRFKSPVGHKAYWLFASPTLQRWWCANIRGGAGGKKTCTVHTINYR